VPKLARPKTLWHYISRKKTQPNKINTLEITNASKRLHYDVGVQRWAKVSSMVISLIFGNWAAYRIATVRLADSHRLPGPRLPVLVEGGVEILVQLARRVIGKVEQRGLGEGATEGERCGQRRKDG
jgi:hypothetical protein